MTTAQKTTTLPFRADHVGSFLPGTLESSALKICGRRNRRCRFGPNRNGRNHETGQRSKGKRIEGASRMANSVAHGGISILSKTWTDLKAMCRNTVMISGMWKSASTFPQRQQNLLQSEPPFPGCFQIIKWNRRGSRRSEVHNPSPNEVFYPGYRNEEIYPSVEAYQADVQQAYIDTVQALYNLGCRYLQLDDVHWGFLCNFADDSEEYKASDSVAAENVQAIIEAKPADLVLTTHVCRGNYKSHHSLEGAYDPIAEELFGQTSFDGYFLEYDTDRSGGFEPLPTSKAKAVSYWAWLLRKRRSWKTKKKSKPA